MPEVFQNKLRLMIVSSLFSGKKSFNELKALTGATDGNLSVQISKLEQNGYLSIEKEIIGKRPNTTCEITDVGRNGFRDYVNMLQKIISETNRDFNQT